MFLLLRVQCLNGMDQRWREQRQGRRVGGDNQRGFARCPLFLKSLQRQVAYVERQQRQLAKLLFDLLLTGFIVSRQQDHLFFMQIGLLHQPGTENYRHQAHLFVGKTQPEFRLQLKQRLFRGA